MKKSTSIRFLVTTLTVTMLLTGCGGSEKKELLTTESEMMTNGTEREESVVTEKDLAEVESLETEKADTEDAVAKEVLTEEISSNKNSEANIEMDTMGNETNSSNVVESENNETTTTEPPSQLVKNVINKIITDNMPELEKVKAIHDWMLMNIDYDYQNYLNDTVPATSINVEGVLTTKYAICDGYAKTFLALCEAADLACVHVVGDTPNGLHAWNQVKIDGIWYNIDVTWDDPVKDAFDDHSKNRYNYFLISDAEMYKDHKAFNANYICDSSLKEQAMQMYCPWRDYNYIKSKDELPVKVREFVDNNASEMRFRIPREMYNVNQVKEIVYETIGQYNVVKDYEHINLTYTADAWGVRTYIFQLKLQNGVFSKYTLIETVEALKAEILRIKGLPDYTAQDYIIYMTEELLDELNHFELIGKWLYFDAELVLSSPKSSKHCEGVRAVEISLRPVTANDIYIENAKTEEEAEAIIQDRLARGMKTFKIRYYYDKNIPNHESYVIYELGKILGEKYGLSVRANPQSTNTCFLEFSPLQ